MLSKIEKVLLAKFGDLEVAWASAELRDMFLELPLRMVEVNLFDYAPFSVDF